ncbi:hypothetical protein [Streptomyces sp. KL116D]
MATRSATDDEGSSSAPQEPGAAESGQLAPVGGGGHLDDELVPTPDTDVL